MIALRLKLFQETANYKKPFAFKVGETYPLPPYATVKGMIHSILNANQFIPMRISIQGNYEAKILDYQTHYLFKKNKMDELPIVLDGLQGFAYDYTNITKMPLYTHLLYNVNLVIHVEAELDILNKIIQTIEGNDIHWSLGRWEDLVRIDEYKLVEVKDMEESDELKYNAYIPTDYLDSEIRSIPYQLNWKYHIRNNVRQWEKINVGYVLKDTTIEPEEAYIDEDRELVFYNLSSKEQ